MLNLNIPSPITKISSNFLDKKSINIFIKRDDLIHNVVSGNKWRKLKYNLQQARKNGYNSVLSFGGAYSNHLHALSFAANQMNFNSIGVIRGDKCEKMNQTLSFCKDKNMRFHYLDRSTYRNSKYSRDVLITLQNLFGDFYMIPEGGNNLFGVQGCEEILKEVNIDFDYILCSVGTGCTAAGLIKSIRSSQQFLGFSPFKKVEEQKKNIFNYCNSHLTNWDILADYHFGGFNKFNDNLIKFIRQFYLDYNIQLDIIYMGKLFYALFDLIKSDFFAKKTTILILHSGGLQGLQGFNFKY